MDYIKNGTVYQGQQTFSIQVADETELNSLLDYGYTPGTIAHTPGYKQVWELAADGTWTSVFESE